MTSNSSSRGSRKYKHDVFQSFQGEGPAGTRFNFTDVLYDALTRKGVAVYIDDRNLDKGRPILDELFDGIRQSRFCVVVFSRDYASSTWCLDELALIVELVQSSLKSEDPREDCVELLPVFHEVTPSDVRHVRGSFAESFSRHKEASKNDHVRVQRWRAAMKAAASFPGWPTQGRRWTELVEEIARYVMNRSTDGFLSVLDEFVGLNPRVREVIALLGMDRDDAAVIFLGIWGMSGIGKTTLAEAVYEEIRHSFEAATFLQDIQATAARKGLLWLQEKLLAELLKEEKLRLGNLSRGRHEIVRRLQSRKVLVVLDNVDTIDQLDALAGHTDCFYPGSRIIITTRDEHLLKAHNVGIIYKAELLNGIQAWQLFCRKAFNSDSPLEGYEELAKSFVKIAGGLPLAIKHFGSSMKGRSIAEWESAISSLAKIPHEDIVGKLGVSFDGLNEQQKRVFLLIAFFFRGKDEARAKDVLCRCNLDPIINIKVLKERCLVTTYNTSLWVHDLMQSLAREIVRRESPDEPGYRSLLWNTEDIYDVFNKRGGTRAVSGIVADIPVDGEESLNPKAFSTMERLKLLQVRNARFYGRLGYLSNELCFLKWPGFPFEALPTSFRANNLVELNMSGSHLKELWRGRKDFRSLKIIKLSRSQNLIRTPDFTGAPNLERIVLEGCVMLRDIDGSIGNLQKLDFLDLRGCSSLMAIPDSICSLVSLRILHLSGCSRLAALPPQLHQLGSLEELNLAGTAIKEVPSSIGGLKKLKVLSFRGCSSSGGGNLSLWSGTVVELEGSALASHVRPNIVDYASFERLLSRRRGNPR